MPPMTDTNAGRADDAYERPFDRTLLRRMMRYVRPYGRRISFAVAMLVVTNLVFLTGPYLTKVAVDRYIMGGNLPGLAWLCALFLFLRLVHWGAHYAFEYYTNVTGEQIGFDIRMEMFRHLQRLSMEFYDNRKAGWIIARLTGDINAILEFFNFSVSSIVNVVVTFTGTIVIMLYMDLRLSLVVILAVVPPLAVITFFFSRRARRAYRASRITATDITINLSENINGVRVTQSFAREDRNLERFVDVNRKNYRAQMHAANIMAVFMPLVNAVGAVGTILVLWFGGRAVAAGTVTIGVLVAFFGYIQHFFMPIRLITELYNHMLNAMASAERIFGLLDTPVRVADAPRARELASISEGIRFRNVRFSYAEGQEVLKGVSFAVRPGQTVALVGPTGAGKSSIMSLISRFYDYQGGSITVDGTELKEFSQASLRRHLGIVLQDTFLFDATIMENILYGRPDASREEAEQATRVIGADAFINDFPDGFDTRVHEQGGRLSSGQRQLISFSRALLRDPRILILDEATSSIDAYMEQRIQHALEELLKDRICFVAAHRLSTIRQAHLILFIRDGMIAEQGTHDELLARDGVYREFYEARVRYGKR